MDRDSDAQLHPPLPDMNVIAHLRSYKNSTGKSVNESTLKSYAATLRTLHSAAFGTGRMQNLQWLTSEKTVRRAIDARNPAPSTRKKMISHVLVALQSLGPAN
jgi:2-methylaconitate cis-trans-isomerase PrpF